MFRQCYSALLGTVDLRMAERPTDEPDAPDTTSRKQPYRTPVVVTWGTLKEITQAAGNHGHSDGGRPPRMKTR